MDDPAILSGAVAALTGTPITGMERVAAGRNSRVFRATASNGTAYAVKQYQVTPERNGLEVEFAALRFLNEHGITQVPAAVAMDSSRGIAVYDFIEGTAIGSEATPPDLAAAVRFVLQLRALSHADVDWHIPAAEACFSARDIMVNIRARASRLQSPREDTDSHRRLRAFLNRRFIPLLDEIESWCRARLAQLRISMESETPPEERILSPSDFGFHNAVRRSDGTIVFVDFEFFGWDDIAKLISDFLLHPAMALSDEHRNRFVADLFREWPGDSRLAKRLPVAYSLFAMKWCMILLNEFIPEHLSRRRFAGDVRETEAVLSAQLAKAQQMCDQVAGTYKDFPYGG